MKLKNILVVDMAVCSTWLINSMVSLLVDSPLKFFDFYLLSFQTVNEYWSEDCLAMVLV